MFIYKNHIIHFFILNIPFPPFHVVYSSEMQEGISSYAQACLSYIFNLLAHNLLTVPVPVITMILPDGTRISEM